MTIVSHIVESLYLLFFIFFLVIMCFAVVGFADYLDEKETKRRLKK